MPTLPRLLRFVAALSAFVAAALAARAQGTALTTDLAALARPTGALVGLTPAGALLRSTTAGASWTTVRAADTPRALYALAASGNTVLAIGDSGYFVRSVDAGASFTTLASALTPTLVGEMNALATSGSVWVAVGERNGQRAVLRSTDNGATWAAAASVPAAGGSLTGVAWTGASANRFIAVGGNGLTGYILTSSDGSTWTELTTTTVHLNAIASDGVSRLVAVGGAGTILSANDGAATASSFTAVQSGGANLVSEDLRAVAFLASDTWVIGGDNAVLISLAGATPTLVSGPSTTTTRAITALASTGTGTGYYVYNPATDAGVTHGPISLQTALVAGQLQLTLVGAQSGFSYHLESSTTLSSWSVVAGSTQAYDGVNAPTWNYPTPVAGGRVFYRAKSGAP